MREYRVKVTVRNNLLLTAIEQAGYKSVAEFCRVIGHPMQYMNALICMRKPPINAFGEFCDAAKAAMEALGAAPSDLWTEEQLTLKLKKSSSERAVSKEEVDFLLNHEIQNPMVLPDPADQYEKKHQWESMKDVLDASLTMKERQILFMRNEQDMTFDEVAVAFGVSKERARQIEAKALRKLRDPRRIKKMKEIYEGYEHC
jgi:RNA polymerase sigma factor (sigma-70 family)